MMKWYVQRNNENAFTIQGQIFSNKEQENITENKPDFIEWVQGGGLPSPQEVESLKQKLKVKKKATNFKVEIFEHEYI